MLSYKGKKKIVTQIPKIIEIVDVYGPKIKFEL